MSKAKKHEPLVHITKRGTLPLWHNLAIRAIGLAAALVVCAIVLYALTGLNPLKIYGAMFKGAFGSARRVWTTIREIMMLLCIGVGLAPAFKMRFWNIGGEGQVLVGGVAAAACMIYLAPNMPLAPVLLIMFVLSRLRAQYGGLYPPCSRHAGTPMKRSSRL